MSRIRPAIAVAFVLAIVPAAGCSPGSSTGPGRGGAGGASPAPLGGAVGSSGGASPSSGGAGNSGDSGGARAGTGGWAGATAGSGGKVGSGGTSAGTGGVSGGSGGLAGRAANDAGGASSASSGASGGSASGGARAGAGGVGGGVGGGAGGGIGSGGAGAGVGGTSGDAGTSTGGGSGTCTAGSTKLGNTCASGWSATMGKYILNNNWWGTTGATGQECIWGTCQDGDVIGWVTNWTWSGGTSSVLTYPSVVFGWQYGFPVANTGLPVQVSSGKAINCGWDFTLTQASGGYDVAYDIWLHTSASPPTSGGQSDEIMIWLNKGGGPAPAGSTYASGITIANATWNLWEGNSGSWPIHSYVRTSNTSSATFDIMAFMKDLVTRGRIPNTRYVSGVQAGIEVRSGNVSGTLTTNGFYCRIE